MSGILHEIAFGIWAIRPEVAEGLLPRVQELFIGHRDGGMNQAGLIETARKSDIEAMVDANVRFVSRDGHEQYVEPNTEVAPEMDMVAVLDINGPILKNAWCGTSMSRVARWMAEFETTREVSGVVLNIDSGGGNGYGMLTLTDQIERMSKPVVAITQQGMACSAAYGIGASCDLFLSANDVDEFGSIGTYVRVPDFSGYYAKEGIKIHTVKATRSGAKNRDFEEMLKAEGKDPDDKHYAAIRTNYIDPFNEHFIALVQRNRPAVKDEHEVLAGRVLFAKEALKHGLIDRTNETLAGAIAAVRELAKAA
jgi:protease-4